MSLTLDRWCRALLLLVLCGTSARTEAQALDWGPELTLEFADTLYAWGDYREASLEYFRYLYLEGEERDRVAYGLALTLLRLDEPERTVEVLERYAGVLRESPSQEDASFLKAYAALDLGRLDLFEEILLDYDERAEAWRWLPLELFWLVAGGRHAEAERLLEEGGGGPRSDHVAELLAAYSPKSPFLAATLSVVVPGAGRFYTGQWQDGLFSLVSIGVLGGFTAYHVHRGGFSSWRSIVSSAALGVFYTTNVYGSYQSAHRHNDHHERRILHAAERARQGVRP